MAAGDKKFFELNFTDFIEDNDLIAIARGQDTDGTLSTTAKVLADYIGSTLYDGHKPITRNIQNVVGLTPNTDNIRDFLDFIFYPLVAPSASINIANPFREVGTNTDYVITWNVVRNTNPITGINVDGIAITPTGNSQTGTQSGNVTTPSGIYTKTLLVDDGVSPEGVFTASLTYLLKIFYGSVSTIPITSADVRALANSQLTNVGNTFVLNTGTTNDKFCIVIPSTMALISVIDQDALNIDLTAFYTMTNITVNDAAGNPHSYKMYAMTDAITYLVNHRHLITIQ